jgi:hypothetical protein
MLISFYMIQLLILGGLSYEDYRTTHISMDVLFVFMTFTFGGLFFLGCEIHYFLSLLLIGGLIFLKFIMFFKQKKSLIGNGDLILLLPILCSLHLVEFPFFLIFSGLGGCLTFYIMSMKIVPFVPSLFLSYGIVLLLRCI